jgi:hypothetical protein
VHLIAPYPKEGSHDRALDSHRIGRIEPYSAPADRTHPSEALQADPAQQSEQDGLCLVVARVSHCNT